MPYVGVLLGLHWPSMICFAVIWLFVAGVTRYSSIAALAAAGATPVLLAYFGQWQTMELFVVLTILVYLRHWANIGRFLRGKESKIGGV